MLLRAKLTVAPVPRMGLPSRGCSSQPGFSELDGGGVICQADAPSPEFTAISNASETVVRAP